MVKIITFTLILLCMPFATQGQDKTSLSVQDIENLLASGLTQARVAELVGERGVNFEVTTEIRERLEKAGADNSLLEAVERTSSADAKTRAAETKKLEQEETFKEADRRKVESERQGSDEGNKRSRKQLRQSETTQQQVETRRAGDQKILGNIELLDSKKNYLILIDKEGKLFTFDFNRSMMATEVLSSGTRQVPLYQIPLRSSASVGYRMVGDKKVLTRIEFRAPAAVTADKKTETGDKKIQGDIGLVDVEKNQLILVTKEGELVTLYFPRELAATQLTSSGPRNVAMNALGIRSSVSIEYRTEGLKNLITKIEFREPYSQ
jgi:Skp family chaperone for outer membrane proteins